MSASPMNDGPTDLYRVFDAGGALLYVGISGSALRRFQEHAMTKGWWSAAVTVTLEHFATRDEALRAERTAVVTEAPKHNIRLAGAPAWTPNADVVLSVRVTRETADALKAVADRNYRPVAAHMRFLIENDIATTTEPRAAA